MIRYILRLDRPSSHLFLVEMELETGGAEHIDLEFPAWSPGRYFIYDFARNVQELRAHAGRTELAHEKIAKGTWRLHTAGHDRIRISYRMFGDTLSGTFSQLDDRHAAINGSSLFGYIAGRQFEPVELEIEAPDGWKSYSSLERKRREGRAVYRAANYDVLIDSPIEIGQPIARKFMLDDVTYWVIIDIAGAEGTKKSRKVRERVDRFVSETEKTVRAYTTTFGRPEFDEYWFLVNIDPYAPNGDGMEHLASTRLVINGYITNDDNYADLVGVMSHEFFHIWNVKRMRPAELGPFDYTRELHTTLLWVAEGFTQYYGHLMLHRAGVWDDKKLYKELVSEINTVDRSPGRFHRNLRASSFDTWHSAGMRSPVGAFSNFKNTYVNYYPKGAVIAFMLDVEIRRVTGDTKSLDDVILELYRRTYAEKEIGDYFLRGAGYTEEDVYAAVSAVTGKNMRPLLRHLVESAEEIDYARYLRHVGLEITRRPANGAGKKGEKESPQLYLGIVVPELKGRGRAEFVTIANVLEGSPADRAGISAGDMVIAIDGERIDGRTWESVFGMKEPGEKVEVTLFRGTRLLRLQATVEERDSRPYRIDAAKNASEKQKTSREKWFGPPEKRPARGRR